MNYKLQFLLLLVVVICLINDNKDIVELMNNNLWVDLSINKW